MSQTNLNLHAERSLKQVRDIKTGIENILARLSKTKLTRKAREAK